MEETRYGLKVTVPITYGLALQRTTEALTSRTSSFATETTRRDALRVATRLHLIPVTWVMCRVIANDDFVRRDLDELIDNLHGSLRDAASVTRRMTLHRREFHQGPRFARGADLQAI